MTREVTPEERKMRTRIVFAILFLLVIVLIILFGQRWYKVHVFKQRIAEMKTLVEAGRLLDCCNFVRERDRESALAAARWAEITGNNRIITEMKLIRANHSADWSVWETVIRFTTEVESGYDKFFVHMRWKQENGVWVLNLMDAREYNPMDGELGIPVSKIIEQFTNIDFDNFLQED